MMFSISEFSSPGPYAKNEDASKAMVFSDGHAIALVADGVGGESQGEIASSFIVERLMEAWRTNSNDSLTILATRINSELIDQVRLLGLPPRVYTTLTGISISPSGLLSGIHVGDSRGLILRGDGVQQLTNDHTEAQRLLREGKLTKSEYKNYPRKHILESAMGMSPIPSIQEFHFRLQSNDRVLVMSDGVYNKISKREIRDMSIASSDVDQLVRKIVDCLERRVPDDNFTIVAVQFNEDSMYFT
jgi:serine/threonine protein phosphatase PrpC